MDDFAPGVRKADGRTHHDECWRDHLDCASRRIERLQAVNLDMARAASLAYDCIDEGRLDAARDALTSIFRMIEQTNGND